MSSDDEIAQDLAAQASLDACNCCDVPEDAPIFNRPGLSALAYRVGTYATFFEDMKAALPLGTSPATGGRPLAALTTRNLDDPTIALLDAAAVLGDILTFYQERIANEGFLRTATERRSVLELAREIGYELNPGVAASTYLAFTVDQALVATPGVPQPTTVALAAGVKVQSVPGPGQTPQMFETTAPITANYAWNAMVARTTIRQELAVDATKRILYSVDPQSGAQTVARTLWFDGTQTNLRNGDLLCVSVGPTSWPHDPIPGLAKGIACVFVANVVPDYNLKRTRVDLGQVGSAPTTSYTPATQPKGVVSLVPMTLDLGNVIEYIVGRDWDEADLRAYIAIQGWDPDELLTLVAQALELEPASADVYAFRAKTGMFGNQAPRWAQIHAAFEASGVSPSDEPWPAPGWDRKISIYYASDNNTWQYHYGVDVLLDRQMSLGLGTYAAFGSPEVSPPVPLMISGAIDLSAVDFAISAKVTGLDLELPWTATATGIAKAYMRDTTAYLQAEPLALTDAPITAPIPAGTTSLTLDRMVLGLDPGQVVVLAGTVAYDTASTNQQATEICHIESVTHSRGYTTVQLANGLARAYVRSTITINGNVAPATQGETVPSEILGSGDASKQNQTFQLAKPPLTYVSAPTSTGGQDTLTVRVNGVAWQEVPTLYGAAATDTVYTVRNSDSGATTIRFGDGSVGARLPTGVNNLIATYRSGLGPGGNLDAQTISLMSSRPLGIKSALNPVPASGGAAAELLANARQNAPRTVRTLERIVSLDDFTDFARGFAGIAKALAVPLWSGETELVHITIAGSDGAFVDPDGQQWSNLVAGIQAAGDSSHLVRIENFLHAYFKLTANVVVDPARDMTTVMTEVTAVVRFAFGFVARDLAQTVTEAEIIAIVQSIPGVIAVEVTQLYRADQSPGLGGTLPANGAHFASGTIVPAELLLLHPVGLSLVGVNP